MAFFYLWSAYFLSVTLRCINIAYSCLLTGTNKETLNVIDAQPSISAMPPKHVCTVENGCTSINCSDIADLEIWETYCLKTDKQVLKHVGDMIISVYY